MKGGRGNEGAMGILAAMLVLGGIIGACGLVMGAMSLVEITQRNVANGQGFWK